MMDSIFNFVLTSDSTSARRVRRTLAERMATTGVIVGDWAGLLEQARAAYLIPPPSGADDEWNSLLTEAMSGIHDAFWTESFRLAPQDVVPEVARSLIDLLIATGPKEPLSLIPAENLPPRTQRNVKDLIRLWETAGRPLPEELKLARQVLEADATDKIHGLSVAYDSELLPIDPWRLAVIEKLNRDSGPPRETLVGTLRETLAAPPAAPETTSLGVLARSLFDGDMTGIARDDTVHIIGVRDYLEEVEIVAGMAQTLSKAGIEYADMAILLSSNEDYITAMRRVFSQVGIPLAGLPNLTSARDPGREAIYYFLMAHAGPMPSMALASLVANPLMPWPATLGQALATDIMRNDYSLRPLDRAVDDQQGMRTLIKGASSTRATLTDQLQNFKSFLAPDPDLSDAHPRAVAAISALQEKLRTNPNLPAESLLPDVAPEIIQDNSDVVWPKDGISVFLENREPWREVRHLFVLGFRSSHFPATQGGSPVFTARDLTEIKSQLSLPIKTQADALFDARALFRRQLASASNTVRIFVPRLDAMGKPLSPSQSLTFIAQTMADVDDAEDLIVDIDDMERRVGIPDLALTSNGRTKPPRKLPVHDLALGVDLLAIGSQENADVRRQSPSSLEKMIVSPLAWLVSTLKAEPSPWQPDVLNPAVQGSIAHDVFEHLFGTGAPIPDVESILTRMPVLMDGAITRLFPVLRTGMWRVEYRNLSRQIEEAALRWREVLSNTKGDVIANEVWLHGKMKELTIHGGADSIVSLPGERILIVDFKKSSSGGRRRRMDLGYDSQATLYRMMIETGGAKDEKNFHLIDTLRSAREIGVLYYMMNDKVSLTDQAAWFTDAALDVISVGPDVASNALHEVETRLRALRKGDVALNRVSDEKRMDKEMGLTAKYALDTSPLIRMFMIDDLRGGA
jgi:ATP-dependent helicase/nuclease subunit B